MIDLWFVPATPLRSSGPMSTRCREAGAMTFREACHWVHEVPYGHNLDSSPESLFIDGRGTCQTKHSVIALLAAELELPVRKYLGAYQLDTSVYPGARAVLNEAGLPFVPAIHCVLLFEGRFFDLTAGNCHGKRRDVTDMPIYCQVSARTTPAEELAVFELALAYFRRLEPALSGWTADDLRAIGRSCRQNAPTAFSGPVCDVL